MPYDAKEAYLVPRESSSGVVRSGNSVARGLKLAVAWGWQAQWVNRGRVIGSSPKTVLHIVW
jgi:hypothetical protein